MTDLETAWCRHVVDDREPMAFADATETDHRDDVALSETGLACYRGVPLIVDGETFGALCYSSREARKTEFSRAERQFVELLAQWIGYELERTRHHREPRAQNDRLDEFVGIVAHDLHNPLSGASAYLELALEDAPAEGDQREYLRTVGESLDRMETLIDELLRLARQGSDVGRREPVALPEAVAAAWEVIDTEEATLSIEATGTVVAKETRLRQLLENLFRNSVEHGPDDVTITATDLEGGFAVADDSPGLPDSIEASLFRPADTAPGDTGTRSGLGLLIVERIVAGHDWTATVESDDGTRFAFRRVERR